jgi:hypothetical protein
MIGRWVLEYLDGTDVLRTAAAVDRAREAIDQRAREYRASAEHLRSQPVTSAYLFEQANRREAFAEGLEWAARRIRAALAAGDGDAGRCDPPEDDDWNTATRINRDVTYGSPHASTSETPGDSTDSDKEGNQDQ